MLHTDTQEHTHTLTNTQISTKKQLKKRKKKLIRPVTFLYLVVRGSIGAGFTFVRYDTKPLESLRKSRPIIIIKKKTTNIYHFHSFVYRDKKNAQSERETRRNNSKKFEHSF